MRSIQKTVVDFSDRMAKLAFFAKFGALTGLWAVEFRPYRASRSIKANKRYWAGVIPTFIAFMERQGQFYNKDEMHEFFLQRFSGRDVIDPRTGEVMAVIGKRSSEMDQGEFATYTHRIEAWMLDTFSLVVLGVEEMECAKNN